MKSKIKILLLPVLAGIVTISCKQFTDIAEIREVEPLSATVTLTLNLGEAPVPENFNLKLINYNERYEINKTMSASGSVTVEGIIPGIYTITASSEMSADGFTYNYSGSAVNIDIIQEGESITVNVEASKSGALVLKEIYYCGSKTPSGGSYFRDQFYEIYNNSETVQNVRGLCIANINPLTATANLPVWPGDDAANYIYCLAIWQVPNDKDYPLNPGESIIIAQMADDHKKSNLNPNCPVSLLSAEFETYVNTTSIISDNPAINMVMAFWPSSMPQWLVTVFGGAYVIFYPDGPIDPNQYVSPVGRSDKNFKVPIANIVDAVELVGNPNQMQLKRMPTVLDAGAVTVGGTYRAESVARKVKEVKENSRVIYYDTNNSTNDFEVMNPPVIRRNGALAPSWNTWK
ncbi:MAG: DUF4876 domain-containing protein [Bacteroidales bacterium]|nr:DUF4876 domain-containing protein [Bacteroidales bacterium]MDD2425855.1 DUF4876 domain-containing protein [Bacteroidales bacterium]MDD3989320.1 DUF4876 domain-containing protein [Bacteroidales bacterium]MDD4638570.1 DUF4876 domain-containing protein [Bacteroidales bacterium]